MKEKYINCGVMQTGMQAGMLTFTQSFQQRALQARYKMRKRLI